MQHALFARPLHRDVLLQIWAVVVALTSLASARGKVELGGSFNPERATALVQETLSAAAAALLAVLLTALVRRLIREERRSEVEQRSEVPPLRAVRGATTLDGIRRRYGRRGREWTDAEALRADVGKSADGGASPSDRPRRAPHVVATLDCVHTIVGVPVELEWQAPDADHVLISVLDGPQERTGTAALHLEHGTDITITAVNEHGSRSVRTPYVRVLPLPAITTLALPRTPSIGLHADVAVAVGLGSPALRRLDAVLDEQAERRAQRVPDVVSFATALQRIRAAAAPSAGWRPSGQVWAAVVLDERWALRRRLARACRRHGRSAAAGTGAWLGRRAADLSRFGLHLRRAALELRDRVVAMTASTVARHQGTASPEPSVLPVPRLDPTSRLATDTSVPLQTAPAPNSAAGPAPDPEQHGWWTPPPAYTPVPAPPPAPRQRRS